MYGMMNRNQNMPFFNPWREMAALERAFFGAPRRPFGHPHAFAHCHHGFAHRPHGFAQLRTDVIDKGDHFLLEADLPGFDKQDITVEIHEEILTVQAKRTRKEEKKDERGKVIRAERSRGFYKRRFNISGIDADNIKAQYADGVLRLTLPKLEKTAPAGRRLEIE